MSVHHRHNTSSLPQIVMDGRQLDETPMLDKLLGLKISTDLKWDAYIRSVAKDVARMV